MADHPISRSRRQFLFAVGAGGVGAAIAGKTASTSAAQVRAKGPTNARPGYRLTPHIGKYYRTAKF